MRRGFTLIDVLVTLAVMSVLISILMPSLSSVRETARQVVCRSNLRQLGIGLSLYAEENHDRLPPTRFVDGGTTPQQPHETVTLREDAMESWDGAGWLYRGEFMPAPQVFYCPSHKGQHHYRQYAETWMAPEGEIIGNYQFRGMAPASVSGSGGPVLTTYLSAVKPGATLLVDSFRTLSDFNHRVGANRFRADHSVSWFADRGRSIVQFLPKDEEGGVLPPSTVETIWGELDR